MTNEAIAVIQFVVLTLAVASVFIAIGLVTIRIGLYLDGPLQIGHGLNARPEVQPLDVIERVLEAMDRSAGEAMEREAMRQEAADREPGSGRR